MVRMAEKRQDDKTHLNGQTDKNGQNCQKRQDDKSGLNGQIDQNGQNGGKDQRAQLAKTVKMSRLRNMIKISKKDGSAK